MTIMLYASGLAAAVGRHKYKSIREEFEAVWRRAMPAQFSVCMGEDTPHHRLQAAVAAEPGAAEALQAAAQPQPQQTGQQVADQVRALQGDARFGEEVGREISRLANTRYGVANEEDGIAQYEACRGVHVVRTNKLYTLPILTADEPSPMYTAMLCGRVDGLIGDDTVVEMKHRVNRLFRRIPEYEDVQMQCYLQLTGRDKGVLVERYGSSIHSMPVRRDDVFWNDVLLPRARRFAAKVMDVTGSVQEGRRYAQLSEDEREEELRAAVTEEDSAEAG